MAEIYRDTWCKPLKVNGQTLYGGAARNKRIARAGGMDSIIADAIQYAFERANAAVRSSPKAKISKFKAA